MRLKRLATISPSFALRGTKCADCVKCVLGFNAWTQPTLPSDTCKYTSLTSWNDINRIRRFEQIGASSESLLQYRLILAVKNRYFLYLAAPCVVSTEQNFTEKPEKFARKNPGKPKKNPENTQNNITCKRPKNYWNLSSNPKFFRVKLTFLGIHIISPSF